MTIPDARMMLMDLAAKLDPKHAAIIAYVVEHALHRRPSIRRAPAQSNPVTPQVRRIVHATAAAEPDMSYQDIAVLAGVNAGRVSEILRGKR